MSTILSTLRLRALQSVAYSGFRYALLLAVFALLAASAHAATWTVTSSDGGSTVAGSLGYIVANQISSGDTIVFASGLTSPITLTSTLTLSQNVTIVGPGANLLTISGNNAVMVFQINAGVTSSISGLTIAKGYGGSTKPGGINNQGTLTVSNSTFTTNVGAAGGVSNVGSLTVIGCTFFNNVERGIGNGGTLTVSNSTIYGSTGSGISNSTSGGATIINSTIVGNASVYGGGIGNSGTVTISNSIVAGNTDSGSAGDDCDGCGTQSANNLISTTTLPITAAQLLLGPLQNNGGPTETMLPLLGSPALGAGLSSTLSTDQRGFPRPTGSGVVSDLGAVQTGHLIVTTTADSTDSSSVCDGSDTCSLRDALTLANSFGFGDIVFAYNVTGTITLTSALPALAANINIIGPGANVLTISGNNRYQVFLINSGATVTLTGLTIANGYINNGIGGGGILNNGTLMLSSSSLSNNTATGGGGFIAGGGIFNNGTLMITSSTLSGNTASTSEPNYCGTGGGIASGGTLTITNSTISGNVTSGSSGCRYGGLGGGIANGGTLTVTNSTLSGNVAQNGGGGIDEAGGTVTITDSIVAGNTESGTGQAGNDCSGCGTQSASNLISTAAPGINPMLGPLAYNGANQTVQTMLPLPGSQAIAVGNPALLPAGLTTDERGLPRTIGGLLDLGAVQTNYTAVQFLQQPVNTAVNATLSPVTLSVIESGAAALNIPVPLTLTGNGTLGGTLTETTTAPSGSGIALATYSNLSVNAVGTDDTLNVSLPITPAKITPAIALTATSSTFDIFQITPTITFAPMPPTSVANGAAPITLSATLNVTGPTISYVVDAGPATITGNTLTFTGAGTVVVEAISSATSSYASASAVAYITVTPATTTTTLTASAASITQGASETLTAKVTDANVPVASGTVTFAAGTTSIGAAQVNAGVATLTTTLLQVGTDSITASFVATSNDAASTSAAFPVTVTAATTAPTPTVTTSLSASSLTVAPGASGTDTLTVTPVGGYTGTLQFFCANLPVGATCSFTPATLTVGASSGAQTLQITVKTTGTAALRPDAPFADSGNLPLLATAFWMPGWLLAGMAGLRKKTSVRVQHLLVLLLLLGGVGMLTACGGSAATPAASTATNNPTPAGTSAVQVVMIGTGNLSQVVALNLTVQ